jgi:hypothetical protein
MKFTICVVVIAFTIILQMVSAQTFAMDEEDDYANSNFSMGDILKEMEDLARSEEDHEMIMDDILPIEPEKSSADGRNQQQQSTKKTYDNFKYKQQQQQQQSRKKTKPSQSSQASSSSIPNSFDSSKTNKKMNKLKSNDLLEHLQSQLQEQARASQEQAASQLQERQYEQYLRYQAYRTPRSLGKIVEEIVRVYDLVHTSLYEVLLVSENIDDLSLKKQYRKLALIVHPDKNPHPASKQAFDAIADAYTVLSTPSQRAVYDKQLKKERRMRRMTWKKLKKRLFQWRENMVSQCMVYLTEIRQQQRDRTLLSTLSSLLYSVIQEPYTQLSINLQHSLEHLALLPSAMDRVSLLHEWLYDKRVSLLTVLLLTSYFF